MPLNDKRIVLCWVIMMNLWKIDKLIKIYVYCSLVPAIYLTMFLCVKNEFSFILSSSCVIGVTFLCLTQYSLYIRCFHPWVQKNKNLNED